jgi:P4 family phage/plasmid primase-like protien
VTALPLASHGAEVFQFPSGWNGVDLTPEHAAYLAGFAIEPDVARSLTRSVLDTDGLPEDLSYRGDYVPGILFDWTTPAGDHVPQLKSDNPPVDANGRPNKYMFPAKKGGFLGVVRHVRNAKRVLIVEGSKQALAAASHAPADMSVYFTPGCWGLSTGGKMPTPDLQVVDGLDVVVCFDGDMTVNPDVHAAAEWTAKSIKRYGAKSVRWITEVGDPELKHGLDDVLQAVPVQRRGSFLERMIDDASSRIPALTAAAKKAAASGGGASSGGSTPTGTSGAGPARFFNQDGLLVRQLADAVRDRYPAALTSEHKVAVYQNGAYDVDGLALTSAVTEFLDDRFRPGHRAAVEEFIVGRLAAERAFLPTHATEPLVNVRNGMLDLVTGELHPHSPSFFSSQQLPVVWDPEARCPVYEEWAESVGILGQLDDLEEIASTMLDPSMTPQKAVFLFGPSRSGKSTFLRLMQDIAGVDNVSAVTLHRLVDDRFAAANVYGKILNVAADLSSRHIQDLSVFKMMTGEDPIQADRKYGRQFAFTNRALFAFSANQLPTVGESSAAYIERIKPFEFGSSFAGREDPTIESRMRRDELSGILRRWVLAYQRRVSRGLWLPTDPTIRDRFEAGSDRVRQWVQECCTVTTEVNGRVISEGSSVPDKATMTRREIIAAFNQWAEDEHGHSMTGNTVVGKLLAIHGVHNVVRSSNKAKAVNVSLRPEGDRGVAVLPGVAVPTPGGVDGGDSGGEVAIEVAISETRIATSEATPGPAAQGPGGVDGGESGGSQQLLYVWEKSYEGVGVPTPVGGCSPETATSATTATPGGSTGGTPGVSTTVAIRPSEIATSIATSATPVREVLQASSTLPEGVVALDIETHSAERLWDMGPEFIRLIGYQVGEQIIVTTDAAELVEVMRTATLVVGHNIMNFDLLAYAKEYGLDLAAMAAEGRIFDTMLSSILNDPPKAEGQSETVEIRKVMRERSLDSLGASVLGQTKTGDLKGLAKEFAPEGGTLDDGFGAIPCNDARYIEYLRGDVDLTARLAPTMRTNDYVKREHRVAAVAGQLRMNGFRVDVELLQQRYRDGQDRKAQLITELREGYGLPTHDEGGNAYASPQARTEGKAVLVKAFEDLGVELPLTPKGSPALGKDAMHQVAADHADNPDVLALVERVQALNGVRTVYGTVLEHLHGDRVHPDVTLFQASGRWSTTKPGLTVFGKKDGKYTEREIFLPEPGHVIIAADLAQVDARALAALSQDEAYLAMFAPGLDLHSEVAGRAFGEPPAGLSDAEIKAWRKDRRTDAKVVGHGWNYGRGVKALAAQLAPTLGFEKAIETAEEFDRRMTESFPRLVEWRMQIRRQGERGELLDNGFGRLMAVKPDRAWTQAPALMGQGCARDLMMEGLLRMPAHLLPCLRAVIHDEVVLSVPEDRLDEYSADVVNALSFPWAPTWGEHSVQIESDCSKPGRNWGEVYA